MLLKSIKLYRQTSTTRISNLYGMYAGRFFTELMDPQFSDSKNN